MKKLKPFDLEAAKAGAKVVTGDGREVRLIDFNFKHEKFPIVGCVNINGNEAVALFTKTGKLHENNTNDDTNLFMVPVIKEGWINLYKSADSSQSDIVTGFSVFNTKDEAIGYKQKHKDYIDTVKIEYEQ